jgi:hypothetical protein
MITLTDIVDWIMVNKGTKSFVDLPRHDIMTMMIQAGASRSLAIALDENQHIIGVCVTTPHGDKLFVRQILTTTQVGMLGLLAKYEELFPGVPMIAKRRGKFVTYNTPRLVAKLKQKALCNLNLISA